MYIIPVHNQIYILYTGNWWTKSNTKYWARETGKSPSVSKKRNAGSTTDVYWTLVSPWRCCPRRTRRFPGPSPPSVTGQALWRHTDALCPGPPARNLSSRSPRSKSQCHRTQHSHWKYYDFVLHLIFFILISSVKKLLRVVFTVCRPYFSNSEELFRKF